MATLQVTTRLLDVVNHYDSCMSLGLNDQEKADLVQFMMSLPNGGEQAVGGTQN